MALGKYIQEGNAIDYTPVADTPAGTVVVLGDIIGLAGDDIPAGRVGALTIEGVVELPKDGSAYTAGDTVDFDGNTIIATAGAPVGVVVKDAAAGDAAAWVKLTP